MRGRRAEGVPFPPVAMKHRVGVMDADGILGRSKRREPLIRISQCLSLDCSLGPRARGLRLQERSVYSPPYHIEFPLKYHNRRLLHPNRSLHPARLEILLDRRLRPHRVQRHVWLCQRGTRLVRRLRVLSPGQRHRRVQAECPGGGPAERAATRAK